MYVWDINLRIFHWLLVFFITFSIISAKIDSIEYNEVLNSFTLGYLDGVTSAIQTQIDDKSTKAFAIAQAVALG